jgi:hypothetical protein
MSLKAIMINNSRFFPVFMELTPSDIMKIGKTAVLFTQWESPPEADKPRIPHLQCCQGFAVN